MPDPWDHQVAQSRWLASRLYSYLNGDMGTGKTGACLLALQACRRVLVVCPIAVGPAWVKQVSMWDSRDVCLAVDGGTAARAKNVASTAKSSDKMIVVVNYDGVWRGELAKQIMKIKWDAIVLDESHLIKSPSGKRSRWLAKLAEANPQAKRICMSGTPCPHSPLDWWGQMRFLDPGILGGSYTAFRNRIANTHPRHPSWVLDFKPDALSALSQRLDQHVFRVTADQVLTLPDAIHVDIPVKLDAESRKFYDAIEAEMVAVLDSGDTIVAANKLVVVGKLQQAASGFATTSDGDILPIGSSQPKASALREWLECLPPKEPVVIFCKYTHDIATCCKILADLGRSFSELSGSKKELASWQQGDTTALVVQQQAGGVGVDMTRACYACYYSLTHSLGDYEQSLARLRRPGQTRPCRFYHLVCEGTVDESIYEALQEKRDVAEAVLTRLTRRALA